MAKQDGLPADLQRTGRMQGQQGNLDAGSKPKTHLAQMMNKGLLHRRDEGSALSVARPHKPGHGYGMYSGPHHVACWSPHQTALVNGCHGWQLSESEQVTFAEAALHSDKLELGKKYKCKLSSRFQPVSYTAANYHFELPKAPQNAKYSNSQENELSPKSRRAKAMAIAAAQAQQMQKPLLARLRQPSESCTRPRPGVAYDVRRLEEWFKLIDTSHSGEITVRKLLIAMLRHQDIMDLIYLLKERSGGVWQLPPSERPTAGKLTRDDMEWVRGVLAELGQDGHCTMRWPEFVEFFRQSGLLLEYETQEELNTSSLGETNLEEHLKKQADEERRFQSLFFGESRRGALGRLSQQRERDSCALAQTT